MTGPRRVLVVDDEPGVVDAVIHRLSRCGFERAQIEVARTAEQAMQALHAERFTLVLLDLRLPRHERDMNPSDEVGRGILRHCRDTCPDTPVIMMTAHAGLTPAEATHVSTMLMKIGARDFIRKPFEESVDSLEYKVHEVLGHAPPTRPAPARGNGGAAVAPIARARTVLDIPGGEVKKRTEIVVNGTTGRLPNAQFLILLALVEARLRGEKRRSTDDLGAKAKELRPISGLRTEMAHLLPSGVTLLFNDGSSGYALHEDIEVGFVRCETLTQHSEPRVRELAAAIAALPRDRPVAQATARPEPAGSAERLCFCYRYEDRKCSVQFDGIEHDLTPAHYEIVARLALELAEGRAGALDRAILGAPEEGGWSEMYRLQKWVRDVLGPAADGLIVSAGSRRFRMTLQPHEIRISREALAAHPCARIRDAFAKSRAATP